MARVTPRVLKGFRDYLPDVMSRRERMLQAVAEVFEGFGYAPLSTPALEYSEILLGKYGTEGDKLLYRFEDNGGRDISLRYDLTVPLARVIGQHRDLAQPFRRYQIAPVWRAEKPGRGRFREFLQCDVDIVGSRSLLADFECMQVGANVLKALGVEHFELRVNDRRILDGLMARLGIEGAALRMDALRSVDKLPKIGWEAMTRELSTKLSLDTSALDALHTFLHGTLQDVDGTVVDLSIAQPGIDALTQLFAWGDELGLSEHLKIDLSIARGLDYYTSTIYETFLTNLPGFGSVMSGGRYDGLLEMFSGRETPAVGISLGVDRLLAGLSELGLGSAPPAADVFVTIYDEESAAYAQTVAAALRSGGLRAQLHLKPAQNMGKQFKAARKSGVAWVAVCGPDEMSGGQVTLKHMASGTQETVAVAEAAPRIVEVNAKGL